MSTGNDLNPVWALLLKWRKSQENTGGLEFASGIFKRFADELESALKAANGGSSQMPGTTQTDSEEKLFEREAEVRALVERWREEDRVSAQKTADMNARLQAGETITFETTTGGEK